MKKNILIFSISLVVIFLLGIGVSYSLWNISVSQNTVNTATTKCFNVEITSQKNSISLENAYPITNEKGKKLTPFSFTITNTCDIFASYTVSLESLKGTTLSSKFLNAMINNEEIKKLSDYEATDTVNDGSIESHILAKGSLGSRDSEDYTLRVWMDYDTTMEDLNNETKTFKSKIVVKAQPSNWSPVDEGYTTLHDAILANEYQSSPEVAIKKIEAKGTPDLSKTAPISADDLSDKGLYKSEDDYGNTYYYRGKVNNNNVYFAGFYWQIIRINGDEAIRLLYNGTSNSANKNESNIGGSNFNGDFYAEGSAGYMYGLDNTTFDNANKNEQNSNIKNFIDNWYHLKIENTSFEKHLADSGFCNDRSVYDSENNYYLSYYRLITNKTPTFICKNADSDLFTTNKSNIGNKVLTYSIGLITADEGVFAGAIDGILISKYNFLYTGNWYWTMTPIDHGFQNHGYTLGDNSVSGLVTQVNSGYNIRPVINLKSDVKISGGIGTINDPYVVE